MSPSLSRHDSLSARCPRAALLAGLLAGLVACGDGDPAAVPDAGVDAGLGSAIVLTERVIAPEGRLYYVSVLSEMPTGPVDRSRAREFTSADIEVYGDSLYVRDRFSNEMTRFTVSADRELVEAGKFSFQNEGLQARRFGSAYLSPTRAFLIDNVGWRLIEWNPTTMALTGNQISIAQASKGDAAPDSSITIPVQVGTKVYAGVGWQLAARLQIFPGVGMLVFDTASAAAPQFIEDSRVAGPVTVVGSNNQDVFMTNVVTGFARFGSAVGGGTVPPSGVVKIANGQASFDSQYLANVAQITQSPGVAAIHRIDERYLLVQMWDPATPTTGLTPQQFLGGSEYLFAIVDTQEQSWEPISTIPKGRFGNTLNHVVDGTLYVQNDQITTGTTPDSVVYAVRSTGLSEAFRVPGGDLFFVKRLR